MSNAKEWSRSRFWLCHFLHSRHERCAIDFTQPASLPADMCRPLAGWLQRCAAGQGVAGPVLISQAVEQFSDDPAYVQSLRLLVKEQQYHARIIQDWLRALGISEPVSRSPGVFLRGGPVLGFRYQLSAMLLADLIDISVLELLCSSTDDAVLHAASRAILAEKTAHAAFHTERLTMAFADFNAIRRNLRRARLRAMFAMKLARTLAQDSPLISATQQPHGSFTAACWDRFRQVLEVMVPYHREHLMRALIQQREQPYGRAVDLR